MSGSVGIDMTPSCTARGRAPVKFVDNVIDFNNSVVVFAVYPSFYMTFNFKMLFWGIKCEMKTHLAKFSCMANTGKKSG